MKKSKNEFTARSSSFVSIGESVNKFLEVYKIKEKVLEAKLVDSWETVMGSSVSSRTTRIFIKSGILFVNIKSAPLKNQLMLSRTEIVRRLNEEAGAEVIKELKVI